MCVRDLVILQPFVAVPTTFPFIDEYAENKHLILYILQALCNNTD